MARRKRRILVDVARAKQHLKRGATMVPVLPGPDLVIDVDKALRVLAADSRMRQLVELMFYGDFSVEETAEALGVSVDTVMRDWKLARVWLMREREVAPSVI